MKKKKPLKPRWEHGYRCHGYWLGTERLARISIGPRGLWDGIYRWELDGYPVVKGEASNLPKARRHVYAALRARDLPAKTGTLLAATP